MVDKLSVPNYQKGDLIEQCLMTIWFENWLFNQGRSLSVGVNYKKIDGRAPL